MPSSPSSNVTIASKSTVYPSQTSTTTAAAKSLKLSVSDIPMLSCHYIQKGVLLSNLPDHDFSFQELLLLLRNSLSQALAHFPALAGRLSTDPSGHVHILCNAAGVDFIEAVAKSLTVRSVLSPGNDVPECVKEFFTYDKTISYDGHSKPLAAVQVTQLSDGVFIGCTVNHAIVDGTSFWHFFNVFAEIARGSKRPTNMPDFRRDNLFISPAVLRFPAGGPTVTFSHNEPLRERIFHFSRDSILKLKSVANSVNKNKLNGVSPTAAEIMGKQINDSHRPVNGKVTPLPVAMTAMKMAEISSFQSLCAHLWRCVTRARAFSPLKVTTFRMAVNCRHRVEPRMEPYYFGNAIQSIRTVASVGELLSRDLSWSAGLLHRNVAAYGDETVRRGIADWEKEPRLFPLGNADGASMTMGSSPRFPMYENDFGWGRPLAVRSGGANKFDGKISAFPGRDGKGSVDLEVVLAPNTMAGLLGDAEFMQYVSSME